MFRQCELNTKCQDYFPSFPDHEGPLTYLGNWARFRACAEVAWKHLSANIGDVKLGEIPAALRVELNRAVFLLAAYGTWGLTKTEWPAGPGIILSAPSLTPSELETNLTQVGITSDLAYLENHEA